MRKAKKTLAGPALVIKLSNGENVIINNVISARIAAHYLQVETRA
jgi:hypothetical protein